MLLIDQGEKKLIKRDLLDENGDHIPFNAIVELTFDLVANNRTRYSYSLSNGDIVEADSGVEIEFTEAITAGWVSGVYDLKATLTISDERFSGNAIDIQTEQNWANVLTPGEDATGDSSSIETGTITFKVIPDGIVTAPENAPAIGTPTTTQTTAQIPFSSVNLATSYEYELESNPGVWVSNGANLLVSLTGLTADNTDRIRVRGKNSVDAGPASPYTSFTTNPNQIPVLSEDPTENVNSVVLNFNAETLEIEYERDGSVINEGEVSQVTIDNLPEDSSFTYRFRYRNAGGPGDWTNISFSTIQAAPSTAPTLTAGTPTVNGSSFTRTSVSGAENYQGEINDLGTWFNVGLTSPFSVSTVAQNTNFTLRIRAINGGGEGPESNAVTVLTRVNQSPAITIDEISDTSVTFTLSAIDGQQTLTYQVTVDGGATFTSATLGSNTLTGLDPETPYTLQSRANNASGNGTLGGDTPFTTLAFIAEPTFTTGSFTNTGTTITTVWSGGGPNYEVRIDGGSVIDVGTDTTYTHEGLTPDTQHTVEVRSVNDPLQSAWVSATAQTDANTLAETSQTNTFTTV